MTEQTAIGILETHERKVRRQQSKRAVLTLLVICPVVALVIVGTLVLLSNL